MFGSFENNEYVLRTWVKKLAQTGEAVLGYSGGRAERVSRCEAYKASGVRTVHER